MMKFETTKAIHAASVLARQEPHGTISRLRLLKLLYIADRRVWAERGRPLFRANARALKNGPLHSEVYNLIQGIHIDAPKWDKHFHNSGTRKVVMHDEPSPASLSEYEIKTLIAVSEELSDKDDWEVVDLTHQFPEYRQHYVDDTSRPIPAESIIDAVGRSQEKREILDHIGAAQQIDRLLEIAGDG